MASIKEAREILEYKLVLKENTFKILLPANENDIDVNSELDKIYPNLKDLKSHEDMRTPQSSVHTKRSC